MARDIRPPGNIVAHRYGGFALSGNCPSRSGGERASGWAGTLAGKSLPGSRRGSAGDRLGTAFFLTRALDVREEELFAPAVRKALKRKAGRDSQCSRWSTYGLQRGRFIADALFSQMASPKAIC